jgi:hypothetical protein
LGCHTIYLRDYKYLHETTGKWVELWLVLKKRTSSDKVAGKIHLGMNVKDLGDDDIVPIKRPLKEMKVQAVADPKKTKLTGQGLADGKPKVDRTTSFLITPCREDGTMVKSSDDDWKVEITSPDGDEVPVGISKSEDGSFDVQYKPIVPGKHKISVLLNHKPIHEVPLDVYVGTDADPNTSEIFGMPMDPLSVNMQGEPVKLHMQTRDKLRNPITRGGDKVTFTHGKGKGKGLVVDNNDGSYDLEFTPNENGKICIETLLNDQPMKTVYFDVVPKADADHCVFRQDDTPVLVFTPAERILDVRDKNGNPIKKGGECFDIDVYGPDGKEVDAFVQDNNDGSYTTVFTPMLPGPHSVQLSLDGKRLPKLLVQAHNEPNVNLSQIDGDYDGGEVGEEFEFTIAGRDDAGNYIKDGGDPYSCEVNHEDGDMVPVGFIDNGDGTYTAKFKPKRGGPHDVNFKLNGANIRTIKVPVHGAFDPLKCELYGPGVRKCYKGLPTRVFLKACDEDGNEIHGEGKFLDCEVTGPDDTKLSTQKGVTKRGKDQVAYKPKDVGLHQLELLHQGKGLKKHFVIADDPATAPVPGNTEVNGPREVTVGIPSVYEILLKDAKGLQVKGGDDDVEFLLVGPGNIPVRDAELFDLNNGKYKIEWIPKQPGKYNMDIKVMNETVKGCPFDIVALEGLESTMSGILSRSFDFKICDSKGEPILPESLNDDDVEVRFEDPQGKRSKDVVSNRKHVSDGVYRITIVVLKPGVYMMNVKVCGQEIPGCPVKLDIKTK